MEIVLGGYLETALVHYCDAIKHPDRNITTHPYYVCLNRRVPKAFFDRAGTFVSLAQKTDVPSIDWGGSDGAPLNTNTLGLAINGAQEYGGNEWDEDSKALAKHLVKANAFSAKSWVHISDLDVKYRDFDPMPSRKELKELSKQIAEHYLCRLFLQVRATQALGVILVLAEPDLDLLAEIGTYAATHKIALPFAFPDLRGRTIDADGFAAGLLNYAPIDALSLMAVKQDSGVQKYASKLSSVIQGASSFEAQGKIIGAMRDAYEMADAAQKAEKVFEIASWAVKPLHYVPVVAEVLAVAEDAKDIANLFLKRTEEAQDWFIVAARMTDISVKDYLSRKGNVG